MNSKSTWIWLTLAAVLAAAVVAVEKYGQKAPPELVALLPEFKAADVTGVQFTPAGQLEIRAERTNGTWQLVRPINYPAQSASIDALLKALQHLAPSYTISPAEIRQRKHSDQEFGFDKRTSLTLFAGEESRQLVIGSLTAPGDQLYVQVVGNEGVFVVDGRLLQFFPRRAEDWRDTSLVNFTELTFDRIGISNAAATLQIQQDSTNLPWRLSYPLSARADNFRLAELLQRLQGTRVVEFITDNPRGDLDAFGLNNPELEITFGQGTNVVARLLFGRSPTNDSTLVYARRASFSTIVTVEQAALTPWLAPLDKFRDPHLISRQRPVDAIEIAGENGFTIRRVATNNWELVDSDLPVDGGFVGQYLLTLVTAPIQEFKDSITEADLDKYGLVTPLRQVVLRGKPLVAGTNDLIADISFGLGADGGIYARRTDENPVYGIRKADYAVLAVSPWQLRDRKIWRFSETNVATVTVTQGEGRVEARRAGLNTWVMPPGSPVNLNGGAIEEMVHDFGELDALAWRGRGEEHRSEFGFDTNSLQVTFELKDGTKHHLEFGGKTSDNYPFATVNLEGQPWYFECPLVPYELLRFYLLNPASAQ